MRTRDCFMALAEANLHHGITEEQLLHVADYKPGHSYETFVAAIENTTFPDECDVYGYSTRVTESISKIINIHGECLNLGQFNFTEKLLDRKINLATFLDTYALDKDYW